MGRDDRHQHRVVPRRLRLLQARGVGEGSRVRTLADHAPGVIPIVFLNISTNSPCHCVALSILYGNSPELRQPGRFAHTTRMSQSILGSAKVVAFAATSSPAKALIFYRDTLGLTLVEESPFAFVFDAHGTMLRVTPVKEVAVAP